LAVYDFLMLLILELDVRMEQTVGLQCVVWPRRRAAH